MRIDVWADLVCPFCHVGRRRLDLALEQFEHGDQFDVIWHSFQLDRNAPAVSDRPVIDQVADKYGIGHITTKLEDSLPRSGWTSSGSSCGAAIAMTRTA